MAVTFENMLQVFEKNIISVLTTKMQICENYVIRQGVCAHSVSLQSDIAKICVNEDCFSSVAVCMQSFSKTPS